MSNTVRVENIVFFRRVENIILYTSKSIHIIPPMNLNFSLKLSTIPNCQFCCEYFYSSNFSRMSTHSNHFCYDFFVVAAGARVLVLCIRFTQFFFLPVLNVHKTNYRFIYCLFCLVCALLTSFALLGKIKYYLFINPIRV